MKGTYPFGNHSALPFPRRILGALLLSSNLLLLSSFFKIAKWIHIPYNQCISPSWEGPGPVYMWLLEVTFTHLCPAPPVLFCSLWGSGPFFQELEWNILQSVATQWVLYLSACPEPQLVPEDLVVWVRRGHRGLTMSSFHLDFPILLSKCNSILLFLFSSLFSLFFFLLCSRNFPTDI